MKNVLLVLCVLVLFIAAGCGANVRTYTFEIDRPDQEIRGNRGYISGQPPAKETTREKSPKRTMIGIDIELPTPKEFIEETGLTIGKKEK